MTVSGIDNDTRGWIMCIVSGIACIVGACVICVDLVVRHLPGKETFRIQESNVFLACSLSLSFGVMIFSALYSMLPSSKKYLLKDGYDELEASLIMMACFAAGFVGIQGVSRILHQLMPSHIVDCEHSDEPKNDGQEHDGETRSRTRSRPGSAHGLHKGAHGHGLDKPHEATPLLSAGDHSGAQSGYTTETSNRPPRLTRRTSMTIIKDRVVSFVKDTKNTCATEASCFGFSEPCETECLKPLASRSALTRHASLDRSSLGQVLPPTRPMEEIHEVNSHEHVPLTGASIIPAPQTIRFDHHHSHQHPHDTEHSHDIEAASGQHQQQHHHHVPANSFLSIGLQTVIAIAIHKFPEGFITYATNHANPSLGFNIFMALFVHNIAEGFAMALPLYMAIGSRWKAIVWSSLLGGFSQPLGAAVAVLVFKVSDKRNVDIEPVVYACLFAVTAGIMASVALQLFVEGLSLNHRRGLSIAFAFVGMVLLGVSNALVH